MDFVELLSGVKYNVIHCGSMNAILYITTIGYGISEIVSMFSNFENTNVIRYFNDENELINIFEGFTVLTDVSVLDEQVRIALKNPELE